MSGQRGRDFLLKLADPATLGQFITVAGARAKSLAFDARSIDITHAESPDSWRELLDGAGAKSARVEGQGLFKDSRSDALLREAFFAQKVMQCQLVIPDFGSIEGPFLLLRLEYSGEHDGEQRFGFALASAGALHFVAL